MIQIKCGTCGTSQGYKTKASGNISLPAAEEQRLVLRGVAAYVTRPIIGADSAEKPPSGGLESGGAAQNTSGEKEPANGATGGDKGDPDDLEVARLERMPKGDLEQMAQDMGVDLSGAKNNHERAELIAAAMSDGDEDGEVPPALEDGDIVR